MHAFTDYNIKFHGNSAEQEAIICVLNNRIHDVSIALSDEIVIKETYDCVFEEDVTELAKAMAHAAPNASFEATGRIDMSSTAGELEDFRLSYSDGKLKLSFSDCFIDAWMEGCADYEDFCDKYGEFSREDYDRFKDCKFAYILETDNGEILSDHVPLVHEEVFEI